MSEIQLGAASHPERCVIAHPFNPPHLIPLVEIVGGAKTSEETIRRASEFYTSIGQRPVHLNKEMLGHVANRLQAALGREAYYLVAEGVLSAADVDTALCDNRTISPRSTPWVHCDFSRSPQGAGSAGVLNMWYGADIDAMMAAR